MFPFVCPRHTHEVPFYQGEHAAEIEEKDAQWLNTPFVHYCARENTATLHYKLHHAVQPTLDAGVGVRLPPASEEVLPPTLPAPPGGV